jgi:hypothetical protein
MRYVLLAHYKVVNNTELEIIVNYDVIGQHIDSIVRVSISKVDKTTVPITDLVKGVPELKIAVDKIVKSARWDDIYKESLK